MLAAVILSGGASRRMGSPKALLSHEGRPFLEHLLNITNHPKISARRVVLGAHADEIAQIVPLASHEIVVNKGWESGQLSSIQLAIQSLPINTDGILLCLIDHPLITANLVSELIQCFYSTDKWIVLPVHEGRRGHPVIFSAKLYGELLQAPPDKGARSVVWNHPEQVHEFITNEEGCVLNLNDPEAFERFTGRRD
jgi:molybdenum cofactor cytidylyltransferase